MCNRLGIRLAFSQAYRPQANGKAEVSGRVIKDMLRKLHIENKRGINWVEALPRVLRIQHDAIDPITGLSPYQIVFGRERALAALPWEKFEEAPEASTFFDHIAEIDVEVADRLNKAHQKLAERINASRRPKPPFCIGDWVYQLKPKPVGGVKLGTWWLGPARVVARVGESSYQIRYVDGRVVDVHATQLRPCVHDKPEDLLISLTIPPTPTPASPGEEPEGYDEEESD